MRFSLCCILIIFGFGCAMKPVALNLGKTSGQWHTKAQIRNLKSSQSQVVDIDFVATRASQLRAEVSATLGVSLATLTIADDQVAYAIHNSKKFYSGKISDRALLPLLQVPLSPSLLFNVLFDQRVSASGWQCQIDQKGLPVRCESSSLKISWSERNGENKRVAIATPDFEVVVLVKSFEPELPTKVQSEPHFFTLFPLPAYKTYQLN